jgi:transposase-like protein
VPRAYAPEFRRRAIDLVRAGRSVAEVAGDLLLCAGTLYRWMAQDRIDRGERPGLSTADRGELARSRRRITELESELEITRKASALFAEGVPPKGSTR